MSGTSRTERPSRPGASLQAGIVTMSPSWRWRDAPGRQQTMSDVTAPSWRDAPRGDDRRTTTLNCRVVGLSASSPESL